MMDDEGRTGTIEMACALGESLVLVVVAALALNGAFHALFAGGETAARACRRWTLVASAVAAAAWLSATATRVPPELPLMVSLAAIDGWLVALMVPNPTLPRATARWRSCPR